MRGAVVLFFLLLVHTQAAPQAFTNTANCKTLKNQKTNNGNLNAAQCSKVTYDEIHHCQCEDDADCTWGGPGANSAWSNNFVCCRPARAATAGSGYALGRCIDTTSENCCRFDYGTSSNPGYVVTALSTATKPRCCAKRNPPGFGAGNIRPAWLSSPTDFAYTDCACSVDADCNELAPYCCSNTCSTTQCPCTADSDCTGTGQVCCSSGNADADPKRCVSNSNCCVFNHYVNSAADNYRRNWKKIFDPETQACCPYGSVVRVLASVEVVAGGGTGSGLSVSDDSFGLTDIDGVFIYTRATNPRRRCRCTGSTGAPSNGRLANGPDTTGCSAGETCCELTGDMINNNWMATRFSASLFDSVQCDPEKPHCLDSCMGMCSSKCEASCIGALLYAGAPAAAPDYQLEAPENLQCCRYETSRTRVLPLSDSSTEAIQNKRFETAYYTPALETVGGNLRRQFCCKYDGVETSNKNELPSCSRCYVDADCTADGEITYTGADSLRCCGADADNKQLGRCIDSRVDHCCKQGTDTLPSAETVADVITNGGESSCTCETDADCPEQVTDGPAWGCCIKPGDTKGFCFTSATKQCCGGSVISWEAYCCATAALLADGSSAKEFTRSAADRRYNSGASASRCPCNDAADCSSGITFEGAAAPGDWECCAPGDDECGLCYNTEEEQCCTQGPAALTGRIMVANGVTLVSESGQPFSEMCCKLTGPSSRWTRAAGSDRRRSGLSASAASTVAYDPTYRGANRADPANDCVCKVDEDCPDGYKCCHVAKDNPLHTCDATYLYGRGAFFDTPDSHCSGRCINTAFQSCCGNKERNAGVICFDKYEKCCGEDTETPTCCNKLSQTCKTGPDDRHIFDSDVEKPVCTTIEHVTPGRTMISIVFPLILALVLILTFVFAAIQAVRKPCQMILALVCVGVGILILILCVLICFSPLWKFSVVIVAALATVLTALNQDTGSGTGKMASILAIVSVLFLVDPFVGNAAMSMHYYVGETLTEGALHTAQALYRHSCVDYYNFYTKDSNLADYRENNADASRYGFCSVGWTQALIVLVGLLVPFHLVFVAFGLIAIGFKQGKDNRVSAAA